MNKPFQDMMAALSIGKSVDEAKKSFNTQLNVGKSKYVVNFHDGKKTHSDGSSFYYIEILSNKVKFEKFKKELIKKGYKEEGSVDEDLSSEERLARRLDQADAVLKIIDNCSKKIENSIRAARKSYAHVKQQSPAQADAGKELKPVVTEMANLVDQLQMMIKKLKK